MIEKLGHSKRIQVMRREWIDEEKPRLSNIFEPTREDLENRQLPSNPVDSNHNVETITQSNEKTADHDLFIPDPNESARPTISFPEPEDDDLDALLREQDDEMIDVASVLPASSSRAPNGDDDDYDAEYEAMKELGM
jgi:replication fork protection complex subunit Csm3/Swi3